MVSEEELKRKDERKPLLLVGEQNPHTGGSWGMSRFAMYLVPRNAAGNRLRVILGMGDVEYLATFHRANLVERDGYWRPPEVRRRAQALLQEAVGRGATGVVMLGRRVRDAFCVDAGPDEPFTFRSVAGVPHLWLPHPSGRCRVWNEPGAQARAKLAVRRMLGRDVRGMVSDAAQAAVEVG